MEKATPFVSRGTAHRLANSLRSGTNLSSIAAQRLIIIEAFHRLENILRLPEIANTIKWVDEIAL